jgi:hypothetical protein
MFVRHKIKHNLYRLDVKGHKLGICKSQIIGGILKHLPEGIRV